MEVGVCVFAVSRRCPVYFLYTRQQETWACRVGIQLKSQFSKVSLFSSWATRTRTVHLRSWA